ncbi:MAG: uracil-DNA glycosylase family protein [Proteobacteria bacterium]|nr:uracil-DNA glycosylase family protein [Pseudomonadota bacterium]
MSPTPAWPSLAAEIRRCRLCAHHLPLGPRPIFAGSPTARIVIIGQAPGRRAHLAEIPFADASGDRLRQWLGLERAAFYDACRIAIMPMGFCYPGTGAGGDKLPNPICATTWHARMQAAMPRLELTLLVGGLAQRAYLASFDNVTDAVMASRNGEGARIALPHPSWHNNAWLKMHSWFEGEMLPPLRRRIAHLIGD